MLREHGFSRFTARSAWRDTEDAVAVLTLRSFSKDEATKLGCTTFSFCVVGGVTFRCLPSFVERPKDYQCPFRWTALKSVVQPWVHDATTWYVLDDGSNLDAVVVD